MKYVIGIDPGTSCGWAVLDEAGDRVGSGTWGLAKALSDGPGMRYIRFERLLRELVATFPDCVVSYEMVQPYGSGQAQAVYYKIVGRMESCLDELGIPYAGVRPAQYKKLASGKGNADKQAVMAAAYRRWDLAADQTRAHPVPNDETDALWIAEAMRQGLA